MQFLRKNLTSIIILLIGVVSVFGFAEVSFAQDAVSNLQDVGAQTGLSNEDPRLVIARIIRVFLSIMGMLAMIIVLYGGYIWMTSAGNPEKVAKAKKILINGVIGFTIILLSWTITSFVISSLLSATGAGSGGGFDGGNGGSGGLGGGSSLVFSVSRFIPEGEVPIRNVQPQIIFSRNLDKDTVENSVVIRRVDNGDDVEGTFTPSGNKITFVPSAACPAPNEDRFCFDESTQFTIVVAESLKDTSGKSLVCSDGSCTASFTTGSLVDTENPTATITYPDNNDSIPADSFTLVDVHATDDSMVSVADFGVDGIVFDSVGVSKEPFNDVSIQTNWITDGLVLDQKYQVEVTVTDISGNTSVDSISVKAAPAYCFNGVFDGDETDIDCGGNYCGICGAKVPKILDISPRSGAPGTFVTVTGTGFGFSKGAILFTSDTGETIDALVPSCAAPWSDTVIVVEVPVGASDGPIILKTSVGLNDATNDEAGMLIEDFDVNDEKHPNLCRLSPSSGKARDSVDLIGNGFGSAQDSSIVNFDIEEVRTYNSWTDSSVEVVVPAVLDAGFAIVKATVGGIDSNTIPFRVRAFETGIPAISSISPSSGGEGQYITIFGSQFGDAIGSVWFESKVDGTLILADTEFPSLCGNDLWSSDQIIVKVPEGVNLEDYNVHVVSQQGGQSENKNFSVTDSVSGPGICLLSPNKGVSNDAVSIIGEKFGSNLGKTIFFNEATVVANDWTDKEILVSVPSSATTGEFRIESEAGMVSNKVNFEIASDQESIGPDDGAAYVLNFSTGIIPIAPKLIIACDSDAIPSAVPNERFSNDVCVNAVVSGRFDRDIDESTVTDQTIILESCSNDTCNNTQPITPDSVYAAGDRTFTFVPSVALAASTTYQVTVTTGVESDSGTPIAEEYQWKFKTSVDSGNCQVEEVRVTPEKEILTNEFEEAEFEALPISGRCQILNPLNYAWDDWYVNPSFASYEKTCGNSNGECITVKALAQGETPVQATIENGISGNADLKIDFTDPYVMQKWPDCSEACVNAEVGVRFNIEMNAASVEALNAVQLYECENEFCTNIDAGSLITGNAKCKDNQKCNEVFIDFTSNLKQNTYYRAIISGSVESVSDIPLTRVNYGNDYSWTFQVRHSADECTVENASLTPEKAIMEVVGQAQSFSVVASGKPDSCSVAGQKLNAYNYNWTWEDPIIDESNVAYFQKVNGELLDTDISYVAEGCTSSCLSTGSESVLAICGNNVREPGEDCDDGNLLPKDGCSASCLNEGSQVCSLTCETSGDACSSANDCDTTVSEKCVATGTNCCGNGTREYSLLSNIGEECDDGNIDNGDGCSNQCINEGSGAAGLTCGDGIVSYEDSKGGEECDDKNTASGDSCSSQCLNEGSESSSSIAAVCGDGNIDAPYETCDDGNRSNGDGCSNSCLREGALSQVNTGFICGDKITEQNTFGGGEDCDGEEWCSNTCLSLGSSVLYSTPSVCGDGVAGFGEVSACEAVATSDSNIDPLQLAVIDGGAGEQVDPATSEAHSTIRVSFATGVDAEADFGLSCVAETDADCNYLNTAQSPNYGVNNYGCCEARPEGALYPNSKNACLNSAVYGLFDKELDINSLKENAFILYDGGGSCPSDHEVFALSDKLNKFFARIIWKVKQIFGKKVSAQVSGDCVVPIQGFTQIYNNTTKQYKVGFHYNVALKENAKYQIIVSKATTSRFGVKLKKLTQSFTTSNQVCGLDEVVVEDTNKESPAFFSTFNEMHEFVATPYSFASGNRQEIEPIPGVYDWEWTNWLEDTENVVSVIFNGDKAEVTSGEKDGEGAITAEATIKTDKFSNSVDKVVSGSESVSVFLCDNPWPTQNNFPFIDKAGNKAARAGAVKGSDWMNFSTYYCRDKSSESTSLYPEVSPVLGVGTQSAEVIKEYFFKVNGSADAIGIRIAQNPKYLSPLEWYEEQGFTGSPKETTVDGFPAVEDGRTVYVVAPNKVNSGGIYSNIYVISYNNGANFETIEIFDQILDNFSFATNVQDVNLCNDGDNYTDKVCSSDFDCSTSEVCGSKKDKLRRDTERLSDLSLIQMSLANYANNNRLCSSTTTQSCNSNSDCPGGESCILSFPTIPSGSFVRSMSSSAWDSWNGNLSDVVGVNLPQDPINKYLDCGSGTLGSYDSVTCVNESSGEYICPENSLAYHYKAQGPFGYKLTAELEYESEDGVGWVNNIDRDVSDNYDILVGKATGTSADGFTAGGAFCSATTYGDSSICGDGVVGGLEVCEIGQKGRSKLCENGTGSISKICNDRCNGFITDPLAACVPFACGNGVKEIEIGEECDDGELNGRYGYCGADCSYDTSFTCGDGTLAGGEVCDLDVDNGVYNSNPANSCSWDCSGPASYCGDGVIDSGEVCDGNDETYSGKLCRSGSDIGQSCDDDSDCTGGNCGSNTSTSKYAECPDTTVCLAGEASGEPCSDDSECPGSACSSFNVQTTRTRTCADDGASGQSCGWTASNWKNLECKGLGSCGDGVVDDGESCDDGNQNTNDSCTNSCTDNVCGDGVLYSGVESCDEGGQNGQACSSAYGSTCQYCSSSCTQLSNSGAFCGDSIRNGGELCDGDAVPKYLYDVSARTKGAECTSGPSCKNVGVCNGGEDNGLFCIDSNECNSGTCVKPSCENTCTDMCPTSYDGKEVFLKDNQVGSQRAKEASLESYDPNTPPGGTLGNPNAATVFMPACTVANGLTGTVSYTDVDFFDTYVVFLTDVSGSMGGSLGSSTRIGVAKEVLKDSVSSLFDELGDDVNIALTTFGSTIETRAIQGCSNVFCGSVYDSAMLTEIDTFSDYGGTPTNSALTESVRILDDVSVPNVRKVVVLLSDGKPNTGESPTESLLLSLKEKDIELFTVALTTSVGLISDMNGWSSGNPDLETGIDYAYDGSTAEELSSVYDEIIESLTNAVVQIVTPNQTSTSGVVKEGGGVPLPFPLNFSCDGETEQPLPIRITFNGTGTVKISNINVNICAP